MNKIAFINGKGGCSKTTSIFHIAGVLSEQGEKVLIIDFDKQRNTTDNFLSWEESNYDENCNTILDYMIGHCNLEEVVKKSYIIGLGERIPKYRNIDILPGDIRLEDESMLNDINIKDDMDKWLKKESYSWVLIDMPPSNKSINAIVFEQIVNYVIVPFSSDIFSVSGYGDLIDAINSGREKNNDLHILGVYLSRYMRNCSVDRFIKEQVEDLFGEDFINIQIPLKADIREGVMLHRPINFYKKYSASRNAFEKLVMEIRRRIKNLR